MARTVLATGAAGFIGAALSQRLLQRGDRVVGLDNLNNYDDPSLKKARLRTIEAVASAGAWRFERLELENGDALMQLFAEEKPSVAVNLAAQAGFVTPRRIRRHRPKQFAGFGHLSKVAATTARKTLLTLEQPVYGGNRNFPSMSNSW